MNIFRSKFLRLAALVAALAGCSKSVPADEKPEVIRLDYATYNPVALLLKEKGYLEQSLLPDGVRVEWVKSLGSNKALEFLNSKSIDFGSSAGAAALIARSNGNPIHSIYVYSKPEWTALVTRPGTNIHAIADLKGKKIAVTRGTDPFVFLLRALDSVGLTEHDVELVQLQHPDGEVALERGDVDAWAGLDPLMATSELTKGSILFFRNPNWNSYGVLNVREDFAKHYPAYVSRVIAAYEQARRGALSKPEELKAALAKEAHLSDPVVAAVLGRTDLSSSSIGNAQIVTIGAAGDVLKKSGVIRPDTDVAEVVRTLIEPAFTRELAQK